MTTLAVTERFTVLANGRGFHGLEQTVDSLGLRVLNVNFVALHSSSMVNIAVFFFIVWADLLGQSPTYALASKTQYISILRAEIERELGNNGEKMHWRHVRSSIVS